jgi:predicted aspartyl protease
MKISQLPSLVAAVAALLASCGPTTSLQPQYRPPSGPSVVPLVRVQKAALNPFVRATVNGRAGLFLVDTGAFATCLDSRFAAGLGLALYPLAAGSIATNVKGGFKIAQVDSLVLGGYEFEKFAAPVIKLDHVDRVLGRRMDGLIGMNVLRTSRFAIDPVAGRLVLGQARPRGTPVPLSFEQGGVAMLMAVGGLKFRMKVDTGANSTELTSADFARVIAAGATQARVRVAGAVDVNGYTENKVVRAVLAECRAGALTRKDFVLREGRTNLLGMDFLRDHVITFDGTTGQAWIEAVGR